MNSTGQHKPYGVWRMIGFALVTGAFLTALAAFISPPSQPPAPPETPVLAAMTAPATPRELVPSFVKHFGGKHDKTEWYISDFYYPNSPHPAWRRGMVHFLKDRLELEVRRKKVAHKKIIGGEYQHMGFHHFGRYEVVMRAAPGSGTVSAMFTHTHEQFGDPHDEIDIEFLGKDLTKVHFNYFRNGKSIQPATFDLPFDAGEAPHLYAFDWRPDGITWYIDGVPFYATVPDDPAIPVSAGKVMFSAWTGKPSMAGWHGQATFRDGSGAQFNCVSFTPMGHDTPRCSDTYVKPAAKPAAQPVR